MVVPFARHVSERGHGHPDGFRFKVKLKTERVAMAFRFVLAYAFVRPESEQNSSRLQNDRDRVVGNQARNHRGRRSGVS